ncbi:MAG TPA: 3-dehydroquinate synthase [Mycobacteriales bacterium]|nr:3-dehydroquinate synthase [Mycobacteriales bacterium]
MTVERVTVATDPPYDVVIGRGAVEALGPLLSGVGQVAIVANAAVAAHADEVAAFVRSRGSAVMRVEVPDGEAAKDLRVANHVWAALGQAAFSRTDLVVGVGGGAVTDLAGFAAATWLRGVPVAHVPTTLLGMVDAAIGGKAAINTAAGKNLVGAFHQPELVVADVTALATLDQADYTAGLAEVVKAGFIADPAILTLVERDVAAVLGRDEAVVTELVTRAVRVKADVVGADPRESGRRLVLNYGHTLAHAIEHDAGYGAWRHGDAVAVGLVYAAAVGRRRRFGALDDATADRHRAILEALGLPTRYEAGAWPRLRAAMRTDKKTRGDRLRFVVLDALGQPSVLDSPNESLLEAAYAEVAG